MNHWRDYSDRVLALLFADGRKPTEKEISEAYPFGERSHYPYKVWLDQVAWWQAGCPDKQRRRTVEPLAGQEPLL